MALIQVDDTNFQKISKFTNVPADQIKDTDLITGLHNGGNANFRIYDIVSKVMEGIDIDPGQDPGYDPGGDLGEQVTYSVIIDHSKSDPAKMCTYADDAIGFNGKNGYENLKNKPIFKKIKPCLLENGEVLFYFDPYDFPKKEDGTNAGSISEYGKDIMIEYGERLGYKLEWLDTDRLKVSVTNRPNAAGFCYDAFSYRSYNDSDKVYVGWYVSTVNSGKSYSLYGNTNPSRVNYDNHLSYCRARGDGYDLPNWGFAVLRQVLYLIEYCNLNSREAISSENPKTRWFTIGGSNFYTFVFGAYYPNASYYQIYNYETGQYENVIASPGEKYLRKPVGTNRGGFLPVTGGGSHTTYYAAWTGYASGSSHIFVGNISSGSTGSTSEGVWSISAWSGTNTSRLMYFHRG